MDATLLLSMYVTELKHNEEFSRNVIHTTMLVKNNRF